MHFDVLVVGGGPAGLSAALILGRCHRTVLLCDEGHQRNLSSHAIHGLLGREGRSPASFLDEARQDLSRYKSVSVRGTQAMTIGRAGEGFNFVCADGTAGSASKVLLATAWSTSSPNSRVSNRSTVFPCIIVFTVTDSNTRKSRWRHMAGEIKEPSLPS